MEIVAALEIAAILMMLIGLRLLHGGGSDHGARQRTAEAIAIGLLAGAVVLVTGLVLSAAVTSFTAPACVTNSEGTLCPDQADQARSMLAGGVAFTMLVAPLVTALLIWRRERALRHGLGALLLVGAAPWALLFGIALVVVGL